MVGDRLNTDIQFGIEGGLAWWRDTPYVARRPDAPAMAHVDGAEVAVDVGGQLERKVAAVACYLTQVPFQFGSADAAGPALEALARDEGARVGAGGPAEVLRAEARAAGVLAALLAGTA